MTSGIKGTQGFQKKYDPNDFVEALTETVIRTSQVVKKLKKLDKKRINENYWLRKSELETFGEPKTEKYEVKYTRLTSGYARTILLQLAENGKIEKIKDIAGENIAYLWGKHE